MDIRTYSGDGKIEKVGKWPISSGYIITFDHVLLNKNYSKEFILKKFPKIGKDYFFGIRVKIKDSLLDELKSGQLRMKAYSENGEVFFDIDEKLNKWTFSKSFLDNSEVESFIFYFNRQTGSDISSVQLKNVNKLIFFVQLDGAVMNPQIEGAILMKVGGFK